MMTDEEAQQYEHERAVLMATRDHFIAEAGPGVSVVEFDYRGQRWITRWQYSTTPCGIAYLARSYPTARPNLHLVT
jgi:hypothetical protein